MSFSLQLNDKLDSNYAHELRRELLSCRGQSVTVNGEAVVRPGTLCLQVLVSAASTWLMDGLPFQIVSPSPQLLKAIATLGLRRAQLPLADI